MVPPGPYATLLVLSGALALGLAGDAWRNRDEPGALPFVGLMIAVAGWSLGYGAGVSTVGIEARKFWTLAQWLFVPYVPVCWLLFALEYAGHSRWVTARSIAALAAIPAAATIGALTNDLHGLMWHGFVTNRVAGLTLVSHEFGPLLVVNAAYAYALILAGTVLIARVALGSGTLYADQASALLIGIAVPWAANVLVMLRQVPVVADGMGIASPTLHRHLRSAHRKLAASEFEGDTAG